MQEFSAPSAQSRPNESGRRPRAAGRDRWLVILLLSAALPFASGVLHVQAPAGGGQRSMARHTTAISSSTACAVPGARRRACARRLDVEGTWLHPVEDDGAGSRGCSRNRKKLVQSAGSAGRDGQRGMFPAGTNRLNTASGRNPPRRRRPFLLSRTVELEPA
jgi:hypothetical protein